MLQPCHAGSGDRAKNGEPHAVHGRAVILQFIASCRFVMTIGDVKGACLLADREERPKGPLNVTMPKSYVNEGMHPEQLFEVRGGGVGGLLKSSSSSTWDSISIRWIGVCSF